MISESRLKKIKDVASKRQQIVVVLEDIHDPHNAAAVLRTCDGFGIQKVCFIFDKGEKFNPLEVRTKGAADPTESRALPLTGFNPRKIGKATSSSANKWLDFEIFTSAKECFSKLKRQGYTIAATVLDAKAKSIFKTKFTKAKTALVFGNEHSGLSLDAIKLSDMHVYIPMQGFVQSFNLSVTAAICIYEVFRQNQKLSGKFLLKKGEQQKLIKNWSKI